LVGCGRLTGHKDRVYDARFSPDGQTIATVGGDRCFLWNPGRAGGLTPKAAVDRKLTKSVVKHEAALSGGHTSEVLRVSWHPSSQRIFTGGADGRLCCWDTDYGEPRAVSECSAEEVYGCQALTPEMLLVSASDTVQQWDIERWCCTRSTSLAAVEGAAAFGGEARNPDAKAFIFALAARGRMCAVTLSDGSLRLIDAEECRELAALAAHSVPAMACAFSTSTAELCTAARDGTMLLWDIRALERGPRLELRAGEASVNCCAFVPRHHNGGFVPPLLLAGSEDGVVRGFDTLDGTLICSSPPLPDAVLCCDVTPVESGGDGAISKLVIGGGGGAFPRADYSLGLWRLEEEMVDDAVAMDCQILGTDAVPRKASSRETKANESFAMECDVAGTGVYMPRKVSRLV